MGVRWSDDKYARRVDHPAFGRRVGSASSMGPGGRTATETGAHHHGGPDVAGGPPPSRPLWGWMIVAMVLMVVGPVACHHENDLLCAEKSCEVQP